jgi:peptide/nickel transport system substrate-binding protein
MKPLRSPRRLRRAAFTAAALALSLIVTGCTSTTAVDPEAEETSDPVVGGVITVASGNDPRPQSVLAGNQANWSWALNVFETLTIFNEKSVPEPLLASEWAVSEDGLSMDITLRDDVTFHSGRTMTAEDVKFTFETSLDPVYGSQLSWVAKEFASIDVVSDTELAITFTRPLPNVFDYFELTPIIDSESVAGLADGSEVVGTGPFVWDAWSPGTSLSLVRNDDYWGEKSYLDGIEVVTIADPTAMVNAVRSGRTQYAIGVSGVDIAAFKDDPQYEVIQTTGSVYPLGMNTEIAPFDNVEVRQAVNFAIDRERIIDQVFGGSAEISTQFWTPSAPGYDASLNEAYPYDPDKATEMLKEAGAAGASFEISVIPFPANISAAEIVRNNLEEVGLKPTVKVVELVDFLAKQTDQDLGPMFMLLHGLGFSPATLLNGFPSLRPTNPSKFQSAEYDELRATVQAASTDEMADATQAIASYITEQAWSLPLVYAPGEVVTSPKLQGEQPSARAYVDFKSAYLEE